MRVEGCFLLGFWGFWLLLGGFWVLLGAEGDIRGC